MKRSIVRKLWLAFTGVILIILVVLWLTLSQFYQNFYYNEQTSQLIRYGETIASIVSNQGQIAQAELATIDTFLATRTMLFDSNGVIKVCSGKMGMMRIGMSLGAEEIAKVKGGENAVKIGYNKALDQTVLAVAVPIKTAQGIIGGVYIFKPVSSLEENITSIREIMALAALIAIIIATILAFFLSRTISRPLILMENVAKKIAEGDFTNKLHVKSQDEIGNLALSLNDMSDKLALVDRQRKDFVANVSHELRTPLHLIQGYSEALLDFGHDNETRANYTHIILDETKRLSSMVEDLLQLSKTESAIFTLEKVETNLVEFLEQIIGEYQPVAKEHKLTLEFKILGEIPRADIDQRKVKQVVLNLLDNACRYGADGEKVSVSIAPLEGLVKVTVEDYGQGIAPDDLPHVWDRFYRVDKSRQRETGGNGLGLALVKNIIVAHGGKVFAESKPREYTKFSFTLPII